MEILFDKYKISTETQTVIRQCLAAYRPVCGSSEVKVKEQLKSIVLIFGGSALNLLHAACIFGNIQVVKFALDIGIDVNTLNMEGWNALHYIHITSSINRAPDTRYMEISKYLLDSGINYKQKNNQHRSPIDYIKDENYKKEILDYIERMELR